MMGSHIELSNFNSHKGYINGTDIYGIWNIDGICIYIYMNHHKSIDGKNESMGYPIESPVRITFPSIPKSMLFMQDSWDMDGILTIYYCCNGD